MRLLLRTVGVALLLGILCWMPSAAAAQRCEAPPGSSAVEQYCEAIPDAGGSQSGDSFARDSGRQDPGGNVKNVPAGTQRTLRKSGKDGAAVVGLVAASSGGGGGGDGPGPDSGAKSTNEVGGVKGETASSADPSGNPLKAVSASVENGATVGGGFIWALLVVTLLMAAVGWLAFRSGYSRGGDDGEASTSPGGQQ